MGKVGIRVQDELGNVKGENDFTAFQRACLPLRTQDLVAYVTENGGTVQDERMEPLVRQAWSMYCSGSPAPGATKLENKEFFGQHGITQGPPPEEMVVTEEEMATGESALEPLQEDSVVAGEDSATETGA